MKTPEFCRAVPDDSPIMAGAAAGEARVVDGIVYVRQSEWVDFLASIMESAQGPEAADKFREDVKKKGESE